MSDETFHRDLKTLLDDYVHRVYSVSKKFPKDEQYGVTSQLRRAALSVILNYVEGFGRGQTQACVNFMQISYGSLKESEYLIGFSWKEAYCDEMEYKELRDMANRAGGMIWGLLNGLKSKMKV
ncbi:MAG: four helix bundle protein [bacterium]